MITIYKIFYCDGYDNSDEYLYIPSHVPFFKLVSFIKSLINKQIEYIKYLYSGDENVYPYDILDYSYVDNYEDAKIVIDKLNKLYESLDSVNDIFDVISKIDKELSVAINIIKMSKDDFVL